MRNVVVSQAFLHALPRIPCSASSDEYYSVAETENPPGTRWSWLRRCRGVDCRLRSTTSFVNGQRRSKEGCKPADIWRFSNSSGGPSGSQPEFSQHRLDDSTFDERPSELNVRLVRQRWVAILAILSSKREIVNQTCQVTDGQQSTYKLNWARVKVLP
jgi:hypothetical protein